MKEKILFIASSILILLIVVIYLSSGNEKEVNPRPGQISEILKAGLDLDSQKFCQGLTKKERKRITKETNQGLKSAGIKKAADCQKAFDRVANYQARAGVRPRTLAISTAILKEAGNQLLFASSSCSLEGRADQASIRVSPNPLVGRAVNINGKILIDNINIKEKITKDTKKELEDNLLKQNSNCVSRR